MPSAWPGSERLLPALCVGRQMAGIVIAQGYNRSEQAMESVSVRMPEPDAAGAGQARSDREGLARHRAGRGRDRHRARDEAVRKRRADRLPADAHGGGAAGDHRAGLRRCWLLPRRRHQGGAARRRHLAVRRRAAAGRRRAARHGQVQPHHGHRFRQPRRGGGAGRHQSRDHATRWRMPASITRPIRPRRSPAPSAATWRRIPAACTA